MNMKKEKIPDEDDKEKDKDKKELILKKNKGWIQSNNSNLTQKKVFLHPNRKCSILKPENMLIKKDKEGNTKNVYSQDFFQNPDILGNINTKEEIESMSKTINFEKIKKDYVKEPNSSELTMIKTKETFDVYSNIDEFSINKLSHPSFQEISGKKYIEKDLSESSMPNKYLLNPKKNMNKFTSEYYDNRYKKVTSFNKDGQSSNIKLSRKIVSFENKVEVEVFKQNTFQQKSVQTIKNNQKKSSTKKGDKKKKILFKNDKNRIFVIFKKKLAFLNDIKSEMININKLSESSTKNELFMECDLNFSKNDFNQIKNKVNNFEIVKNLKILENKTPLFIDKDISDSKFDKVRENDTFVGVYENTFGENLEKKLLNIKTIESEFEDENINLVEKKTDLVEKKNDLVEKKKSLETLEEVSDEQNKHFTESESSGNENKDQIKKDKEDEEKGEKNEKQEKINKSIEKEDLKNENLIHIKFYREKIYISHVKIGDELLFRDEYHNFENLKQKILKDKKKKNYILQETNFIFSNYHFLYYLKIPKINQRGEKYFLEMVGKIKSTLKEDFEKNKKRGKIKILENLYKKEYLSYDSIFTFFFTNFNIFIAHDHSTVSFCIEDIGEFEMIRN
jgi:hypothetical protein